MMFKKKTFSLNLKPAEKSVVTFPTKQLVFFAGLFVVLPVVYYFYSQSLTITISKESQAAKLVQEVGMLMVLPEGEAPTIATVTDPRTLAGQPFFAHALEGDKVLVYPNEKKAILFRPSIHKIIEVMPFELPPETGKSAP